MRVVAFDTETHLFRPGRMAPPIVCLSWAEEDRSGLVVGRPNIEVWLREHLGKVRLVGHVVAYDTACVLSTFPRLTEQVFDAYGRDLVVCTAVRERLLDIGEGELNTGEKGRYSLAGLARRRLDMKLDKGADTYRMRYAELDGVPLEQWPRSAVEYAVKDATTTLALVLEQEGRIKEDLPTQFADSRADFALRLMSVWGVITDRVQVEQLWESTVGRMEALVPELEAAKLVTSSRLQTEMFAEARRRLPEVRRSTKRLRELVLQTYRGKEELPRTEKGAIQTTKAVLRDCTFPPLQKLLEFTGLQKAASTYIRKLFAPVVHARFDAVGAASDRTSSSGPNMQNQPRLPGIRECIVARPGHVLLACDFDSQEMRTLAQSCLDIVGSSHLAARYQADRHFDPHTEFAASLAGVSVEEALRLKKEGNKEIKEYRQRGKVGNFSLPGGLGAKKLVQYARGYGVELTEQQAKELKESWFQQWPEMRGYFRHVEAVVGRESYGTMVIPRSGFRRGGVGYTDCSNGYFQTLAAHASKEALWDVTHKCFCDPSSALFDSRPVLFVHDEIILETPEERGHEAAQELETTMVAAMERWTPDVPCAASATLMRRWSKGAEQAYDGDRLIPWEDEDDDESVGD